MQQGDHLHGQLDANALCTDRFFAASPLLPKAVKSATKSHIEFE